MRQPHFTSIMWRFRPRWSEIMCVSTSVECEFLRNIYYFWSSHPVHCFQRYLFLRVYSTLLRFLLRSKRRIETEEFNLYFYLVAIVWILRILPLESIARRTMYNMIPATLPSRYSCCMHQGIRLTGGMLHCKAFGILGTESRCTSRKSSWTEISCPMGWVDAVSKKWSR